jgi:hypothetical protein
VVKTLPTRLQPQLQSKPIWLSMRYSSERHTCTLLRPPLFSRRFRYWRHAGDRRLADFHAGATAEFLRMCCLRLYSGGCDGAHHDELSCQACQVPTDSTTRADCMFPHARRQDWEKDGLCLSSRRTPSLRSMVPMLGQHPDPVQVANTCSPGARCTRLGTRPATLLDNTDKSHIQRT